MPEYRKNLRLKTSSPLVGEPFIDDDEKSYADQGTKYRLCGAVVHSGQASGGHYYSFIKHQEGNTTK